MEFISNWGSPAGPSHQLIRTYSHDWVRNLHDPSYQLGLFLNVCRSVWQVHLREVHLHAYHVGPTHIYIWSPCPQYLNIICIWSYLLQIYQPITCYTSKPTSWNAVVFLFAYYIKTNILINLNRFVITLNPWISTSMWYELCFVLWMSSFLLSFAPQLDLCVTQTVTLNLSIREDNIIC